MSPFMQTLYQWAQLLVTIGAVAALVKSTVQTVNRPNSRQNERLDALETWRASVDARLDTGNVHFDEIDRGTRVTQEALLALMGHALNGNDIENLKKAKKKLENYLIEK